MPYRNDLPPIPGALGVQISLIDRIANAENRIASIEYDNGLVRAAIVELCNALEQSACSTLSSQRALISLARELRDQLGTSSLAAKLP